MVDYYLRIIKNSKGVPEEKTIHEIAADNLYIFHRKNHRSYPIIRKSYSSNIEVELVDVLKSDENNAPKLSLCRVGVFLDMCCSRGMSPDEVKAHIKKSFIMHDIPELATLEYFSYEELLDGVDEEKSKLFFADMIV